MLGGGEEGVYLCGSSSAVCRYSAVLKTFDLFPFVAPEAVAHLAPCHCLGGTGESVLLHCRGGGVLFVLFARKNC